MPALLPPDPAMRAFEEHGAKRLQQGHDALWGAFFQGYLVQPVPAPFLPDLYPWYGNPAAIIEKFMTVYKLEGYSLRVEALLMTALRNIENVPHLESRMNRVGVADLAALAPNPYDREGMRRLQEFFDFLYDVKLKLKNGRWRAADIVAVHDTRVQDLFKELGELLHAAGQ